MRLALPTCCLCLVLSIAAEAQQPSTARAPSQPLVAMDSTALWQYPYQVSPDRRQQVVAVLRAFRDSCLVADLVRQLGAPARIEELSKHAQPLSAFDDGFLLGAGGRVAYRLVWFVKKLSRSPGVTDAFLAAYVRADGRTVRALHGNGLD
jgi:hypothetical protein